MEELVPEWGWRRDKGSWFQRQLFRNNLLSLYYPCIQYTYCVGLTGWMHATHSPAKMHLSFLMCPRMASSCWGVDQTSRGRSNLTAPARHTSSIFCLHDELHQQSVVGLCTMHSLSIYHSLSIVILAPSFRLLSYVQCIKRPALIALRIKDLWFSFRWIQRFIYA